MLSRFFFGLVLLLTVASARAAEDAASWSKSINGLRGRLIVQPSEDARSPFCRIYVELQNVARGGILKVAFSPGKIAQVADQAGQAMPAPGIGNYDGISPTWKEPLVIPVEGTLRFRISFPGAGYNPAEKSIIDLGPTAVWVIPQD
ncbi:MAG TPA: hypothetical protein VGO11_07660, partial [Chthoniobacteraceae bacterium]|nr:hypothetical protein [Chthoniobacteraceae bacterium]